MKRLVFIMIVLLFVLQSKANGETYKFERYPYGYPPGVAARLLQPWPWQNKKDYCIPNFSPEDLPLANNKPVDLNTVIENSLNNDKELKEKQIDVLVFAVDSRGVYVSVRKHNPEDLERILNIIESVIPKSFSIYAVLLDFGLPLEEKIDDVTLANTIRTALEEDEILQTKNTKANVTVYKELISIEMRKSDLPEAKRVESILRHIKGIQTVRIHLN